MLGCLTKFLSIFCGFPLCLFPSLSLFLCLSLSVVGSEQGGFIPSFFSGYIVAAAQCVAHYENR